MAEMQRGSRSGGRRQARWAAVWLALSLGSGCEFRSEQVRPAGDGRFWPAAAARQAPQAADRPERDASQVEFIEGYAAAARQAAAEGRPLLVVFGAEWCRWSGELARGPLADRDVVARTRRFVCVFVDADREPATCGSFGVSAFPTVVVLDPDGRERFRATGSGGAGGLAAALDAVPSPRASPRRLADDGGRTGDAKDVTR